MNSLRVSVKCDEAHALEVEEIAPAPSAKPASHTWVDHLIDGISVVAASSGRLRFLLDFKGDEILSDSLRRELHRLPSVKLGSYSVRTRTALVTFDPAFVSSVDISVAVMRGVKEFARLHGDCDLDHHHHERKQAKHAHAGGETDCDHDHTQMVTDAGIRKELLKLGATGAVLGYVVYKRLKSSPLSVAAAAASPLSLTAFVTIAAGYPIFRDGYKAVKDKKKPTDDTLIGIAVAASLLMGESLTGLSVVWLIQLGRILELITLKRSRTAVKELMDITPTEAWLVVKTDSGKDLPTTRKVSVDKIRKSETIRVFHGEKVALDGKISRGTALIRESFLTGESIPRQKTVGDMVYAGSVVEAGEIDIEVTSLIHDTVVATMIDAIENLRDRKAPIEKVGTRFASTFVPISIGISIVTLLVTRDLRRAVTMLVIACPCAAGLATPTAVSSSIGQLARRGILIKGGTHLEAAARVDTVIFDKTGTLTLGAPVLHHFVPTAEGKTLGADECLRLAASAEQNTTHPLGRVLVKEAGGKGLTLSSTTDYLVREGLGVEARVEGREIHVGSRRFMTSLGVAISASDEGDALRGFHAGESLMFLSVDRVLHGVFVVEDSIRPDADRMIRRLTHLGITRFMMATGDQKVAAEKIAKQLGITEVHAELLPQDKLALVERLKSEGRRVAMMGDGVNDAQALAKADVSIAMGASRCDVAIETSDVTIARDDLMLVPELFDASRKTLRTIYQNFIAAVAINAGGVAYGAMGQLSPFSAAIVHNASTIAVVLNSLRLGKAVGGESPLKALKEIKV